MNSESVVSPPVELGRVLETVHAQQSQIHGMLATLDTRSRDFDQALGDAVQRAFMDAAGVRAGERLNQLHRATSLRFAVWAFAVVSACSLVPAVLTWMAMPSRSQLMQARETLDQLSARIAQLSREGGRVDLRHCGESNRLCVRIDRKAPFYGADADFAVVKGY
jgi:hypothetical protein